MTRSRAILQPHVGNAHRLSLRHGLGSSRFARHYSGNRCFFLFLGLLRCFSSPAYLQHTYGFSVRYPRITTGGFPHSEIPGSTLVRQLPEAYRSHQRPSSAPGTKASTVCPCSLDRYSPSFENTTSTAVQFSRYLREASRSSARTAEHRSARLAVPEDRRPVSQNSIA